ncbi:hypothetical protein CAL12_02600 [Bordetella genomosp. 8]|uniref:Uncharacterized protein n=1 Tax=Bordetella genomosp. 8 TaxID=1416806 RepID=A0A1W6YFG0_9BORD|nr:hypothetical protein [Bordetella genomosp. 8]ARP79825.1 hypothetical protein CAL12_02600 [Bordetella genomosp. 8]
MDNALTRFLRALAFTVLALIGGVMALVFMVSTAIAVGILYVIAKVRGRPFGVKAYWHQRNASRGPAAGPFQGVRPDVIDVEVREVR